MRAGSGHGVRRFPLPLLGALGLVAVLLSGSWGAISEVADLFRARQYSGARTRLAELGDDTAADELLFWQTHLARSPQEALSMLERGLKNGHLPVPFRFGLALDAASIEMSRGRFRSALSRLLPFLDAHPDAAPGEAFLLASIGLRAVGDLQRAREMLASVRPEDPSFLLARHYLGEISLELGDPTLALRYFDSAASTVAGAETAARQAAGRWQALRLLGREREAESVRHSVAQSAPGSLALLEIRHLERDQQEEQSARYVQEAQQTEEFVAPIQVDEGRYSLQLGAFSDRSLALDFLRRFAQDDLELRIDEVQDERGQFLYKVRCGHFVSRAQASSRARQLASELGIEIFVTDLSD